jgi:hypothetical protein
MESSRIRSIRVIARLGRSALYMYSATDSVMGIHVQWNLLALLHSLGECPIKTNALAALGVESDNSRVREVVLHADGKEVRIEVRRLHLGVYEMHWFHKGIKSITDCLRILPNTGRTHKEQNESHLDLTYMYNIYRPQSPLNLFITNLRALSRIL